MGSSNGNGGVPPGFRFHPTDEELLHYYLKKKVSFQKFDMDVIREVDLNKIEPWDLQERCKIGSAPQSEWYFFSHKDRKYPTGSRTNRATNAGFWKATGRDKCIRNTLEKIGMRKTLVFYRGRAPHGQKTDWIMHEYRLDDPEDQGNPDAIPEDGWVVCRVFKKKNLFKVGGGASEASAPDSFDDHLILNNDNHMYHHQYLLHQHEDHMTATQHYSHIPPHHYSQFHPHNFLPLPTFHKQPLPLTPTYNGFATLTQQQILPTTTTDHCESAGESDQNICYKGLEAQTCDHTSRTSPDATTSKDDPDLSTWSMVDPRLLASSQPEYGNTDDAHAHEDVNASSMTHINPLSIRGEMDLWAYRKL